MSKNNKKNTIEKYFTQKNFSVLEIICVVAMLVGFILFMWVWGGGPIGVPMFAAAGMILIFSRSTRAKHKDIDDEIAQLIDENRINTDTQSSIQCFDMGAAPVIKGKDGKCRSPHFYITNFAFGENETQINTYAFDLVARKVEAREYLLKKDAVVTLVEKKSGYAGKKALYLHSDAFDSDIPVAADDVVSEGLVAKVCKEIEH